MNDPLLYLMHFDVPNLSPSEKSELTQNAKRIYVKALTDGWSIDEDSWWWRPIKPGELHFDECHFGFTTEHFEEGEECANCVFVRSPAYALSYDRGVIVPYSERERAFHDAAV
jgi:hypothetical protein